MSLRATVPTTVSVEANVRVPRGAAGDLEAGVASVLENVDRIEEVALETVRGVRPTWTDVRVEAEAALAVADLDDEAPLEDAEALLADGFGVTEVHSVELAGE